MNIDIHAVATRIIQEVLERPLCVYAEQHASGFEPPPLSTFKHLEPMEGFGLPYDEEERWFHYWMDVTPDVLWPVHVGVICEKEYGIFMETLTTVNPKIVRGKVQRMSHRMSELSIGMEVDGELHTVSEYLAWWNNTWLEAGCTAGERQFYGHIARTDEEKMQPFVLASIALTQRYEWAVSLALSERTPSIRFATDPTGIKDMFRIRDLPEGKDRRAALMTWITDHWRQNRNDPDIETYVRKHLRGETQFTWKNLRATLLPSQFDLEQRDRFMRERQQMKKSGADKRKRVA